MTNETENPNVNETENDPADLPQINEFELLKQRARLMGIKHSNNIGLEALRAKINEKLESENQDENSEDEVTEAVQQEAPAVVASVDPIAGPTAEQIAAAKALLASVGVPVGPGSAPPVVAAPVPAKPLGKKAEIARIRAEARKEELKLIRLRITNMDPKKKDLPGEIFTVANRIVGNIRKFVPYGEATQNGYHVPNIIYKQLRDRQFLNIRTRKTSNGQEIVEHNYVKEFALEVLPPLTEKELAQLAAAQAAGNNID